MLKRMRFSVHLVRLLLLILAFGAVSAAGAQGSGATTLHYSDDARLSVRIPSDWIAVDYTSVSTGFDDLLVFGDSKQSVQRASARFTSNTAEKISGISGAIAIIDPDQITLQYDTQDLLNYLILPNFINNAGMGNQQLLTIGNGEMATTIVMDDQTIKQKAIFGVFLTPFAVLEFWIQAPENSFDANADLFLQILQSIHSPAETTNAQPTASPAVNITSPNGTFSLQLPQSYTSDSVSSAYFTDAVVFGSTPSNEQLVAQSFAQSGLSFKGFDGITGLFGVLAPGTFPGSDYASITSDAMQQLETVIQQTAGAQVIQAPQERLFGGQYHGELLEINVGYIAIFYSDQQIMLALVLSNDVNSNRTEMDAILNSVQFTTAVQAQPTLSLSTQTQVYASTDGKLLALLPAAWTILDRSADANTLAFGDSHDAAQSRLDFVLPPAGTPVALTGMGGLVVVHAMSEFNINPQYPDLQNLITQTLNGLTGIGYTIVDQITRDQTVLLAVISGPQYGYVAIVPMGDQILYIMATAADEATFTANQDGLLSVVNNIQIKSSSSTVPTPTPTLMPTDDDLSGLTNLLHSSTAAPATPEPTPTSIGFSGIS